MIKLSQSQHTPQHTLISGMHDGSSDSIEEDSKAARSMLQHTQNESDRVAKKVRAEEDRKRALQLQKQKEKDLKKLARLEKSMSKLRKAPVTNTNVRNVEVTNVNNEDAEPQG